MTEIIVALITGGLSLIGVVVSNRANARKPGRVFGWHRLSPTPSWKSWPARSGNTTTTRSGCQWLRRKSRSSTTGLRILKNFTKDEGGIVMMMTDLTPYYQHHHCPLGALVTAFVIP